MRREEEKKQVVVVYHGGDLKALKSLKRFGSVPGLYVFTNEGCAEGHAAANYGEGEMGYPAVVEVRVNHSWLRVDPEYRGYNDGVAFIVSRNLPPEAFGIMYTWKSNRWAGG